MNSGVDEAQGGWQAWDIAGYDEAGEFGPVGFNTSYALVKMGNAKEADAVMEAYAGGHMNQYKSNDQAMHLKVTRFDKEVAINSTGKEASHTPHPRPTQLG